MSKIRIREQRAAVAKPPGGSTEHLWDFLRAALSLAQTEAPFGDFVGKVCLKLSELQGFDSTEIWIEAHGREIGCRWTRDRTGHREPKITFIPEESSAPAAGVRQSYEQIRQRDGIPQALGSPSGGLWIRTGGLPEIPRQLQGYGLLILLPFQDQGESNGLVVFKNHQFRHPDPGEIARLELFAESLAIALGVARTRAALAERIKSSRAFTGWPCSPRHPVQISRIT